MLPALENEINSVDTMSEILGNGLPDSKQFRTITIIEESRFLHF